MFFNDVFIMIILIFNIDVLVTNKQILQTQFWFIIIAKDKIQNQKGCYLVTVFFW